MTSNFARYRKVHEQTSISKTYNILNKQSSQNWKTKVFNLQKVQQYKMQQVLEYNQQVLSFCCDCQNIVHLERIFSKQNQQYLVLEMFQQRLPQYMSTCQQIDKQQVKQILKDIMRSICDVIMQDFMILNLRPEHIVKTTSLKSLSQKTNTSLWKIDSFVFDYQNYHIQQCQYQFDFKWASNQEKQFKQSLTQNQKDQQIVWYMGIIALRLIYLDQFQISSIFSDKDLNTKQIKDKSTPEVFQLIMKCVKANRKDRISLKQLANLRIFDKLYISKETKQKLQTGNSSRIQKSSILRSSVLKKSQIKKSTIQSFNKGLQVPKKPSIHLKQSQSLSEQILFVLQKVFTLCQIKTYTQTLATPQNISLQDKVLMRYIYLKIAQINLSHFLHQLDNLQIYRIFKKQYKAKYQQIIKVIRNNQMSDDKCVKKETIKYENKLIKVNQANFVVFKGCQQILLDIKDNIIKKTQPNLNKLIQYFQLINGKWYSNLRQNVDHSSSQQQNYTIRKRSLCYLVFCSYILLSKQNSNQKPKSLQNIINEDFLLYKIQYIDAKKLDSSEHVTFNMGTYEHIYLREYIQQGKLKTLIKHSQQLLQKYFKIKKDEVVQEDKTKTKQKGPSFVGLPQSRKSLQLKI